MGKTDCGENCEGNCGGNGSLLIPIIVLSCVQLFVTLWTVAHQALCPWDSPGKNTGVGFYFLLWAIFPSRDWTCVFCLLHWQVGSLPLAPPGNPPSRHYSFSQDNSPYPLEIGSDREPGQSNILQDRMVDTRYVIKVSQIVVLPGNVLNCSCQRSAHFFPNVQLKESEPRIAENYVPSA